MSSRPPIPLPALNSSFGSGAQDRAAPEVRFFFDLVCPYAYLASTQLPALCERLGARIDYRPILLGGVLKALNSEPSAGPPAKQAMTRLDVQRWAAHLGVPLRFPAEHPRRTVEAMRLLCWAPRAARPVLIAALYRAYWVESRDITDPAVLAAIAAGVGLDGAEAERGLRSADVAAALRARTEEAIHAGVFGVPTFVVEGQSGPRLYFGQDRLHFVEQALRSHPLAWSDLARATPASPHVAAPAGQPPSAATPAVANEARRVTFFYDFASPFSYLASTQIEAVAARSGAVVTWMPILVGGLFRSVGTPLVPISTYPPAKRRHSLEDMTRWASYYDVSFHFPSRFPMVTVTALRLALLAGERVAALSHALFRSYWVADNDLNDPAVLESALTEAGLDPVLLARVTEPAVKKQLQDNTEAAAAAGVFGVPSFLVEQHHGDPSLFFGQDRLLFVEAALRRGTGP